MDLSSACPALTAIRSPSTVGKWLALQHPLPSRAASRLDSARRNNHLESAAHRRSRSQPSQCHSRCLPATPPQPGLLQCCRLNLIPINVPCRRAGLGTIPRAARAGGCPSSGPKPVSPGLGTGLLPNSDSLPSVARGPAPAGHARLFVRAAPTSNSDALSATDDPIVTSPPVLWAIVRAGSAAAGLPGCCSAFGTAEEVGTE